MVLVVEHVRLGHLGLLIARNRSQGYALTLKNFGGGRRALDAAAALTAPGVFSRALSHLVDRQVSQEPQQQNVPLGGRTS